MWGARHVLAAPVVGYALEAAQPATKPWAALYVPAELDERRLERFCELLVQDNADWLREHPEAPDLYRSGARYELRPEHWLAIPWALTMARMGVGLDCKVLATWRAAELRVRYYEPRARCGWTRYLTPDKIVYHVWVLRQDGRKEDPSALLGMHSALPEANHRKTPWTLSPSLL